MWSPNRSFWSSSRFKYSTGKAGRIPNIPLDSSMGTQPSACWCFSTHLPRKRTVCSVPLASNPRGQTKLGSNPDAMMACRCALAISCRLPWKSAVPWESGPKTRRETSPGRMPALSRSSSSPQDSGVIPFWLPWGFKSRADYTRIGMFAIPKSRRRTVG